MIKFHWKIDVNFCCYRGLSWEKWAQKKADWKNVMLDEAKVLSKNEAKLGWLEFFLSTSVSYFNVLARSDFLLCSGLNEFLKFLNKILNICKAQNLP